MASSPSFVQPVSGTEGADIMNEASKAKLQAFREAQGDFKDHYINNSDGEATTPTSTKLTKNASNEALTTDANAGDVTTLPGGAYYSINDDLAYKPAISSMRSTLMTGVDGEEEEAALYEHWTPAEQTGNIPSLIVKLPGMAATHVPRNKGKQAVYPAATSVKKVPAKQPVSKGRPKPDVGRITRATARNEHVATTEDEYARDLSPDIKSTSINVDGVEHPWTHNERGKVHHLGRERQLRDLAQGPVPRGYARYPDHEHQNVANLPEQGFMNMRHGRLELDNAAAEDDLEQMRKAPGHQSELKTPNAHGSHGTRRRVKRNEETTPEQRIQLREDGRDTDLRANLASILDVQGFVPDEQEANPPQTDVDHNTAQPRRRTKRKSIDDSTASATTDGQQPASKKPKLAGAKVDEEHAAEPRRSKRKAAPAGVDNTEATAAAGTIAKKRKVDITAQSNEAVTAAEPARRQPVRNASRRSSSQSITEAIASFQAAATTVPASDSALGFDAADEASNSPEEAPAPPAPKRKRVVLTAAAADLGSGTTAKKAKTSKSAVPVIRKGWNGTPSGHGYSTNAPPEAELTVPWQCGFRDCASGMTWLTRNGGEGDTSGVGRKAISQFFGRNKRQTKLIDGNVWHWFCRKHYQRDKYAHDRSTNQAHPHQDSALFTIENIEHQLVRLEFWRPQATFEVKLMTGASRRLQEWYAIGRRDGSTAVPLPLAPVKAKTAPSPEQHSTVALLQHCDNNFLGGAKTYTELRQMLAYSSAEITAGRSMVVAPLEFLLNNEVAGEPVNDTTLNYQQWEAHVAGTAFSRATAHVPGAAPKPRRGAMDLKPFTPVDPSRFEDEATAADPVAAKIRNAQKMGLVYKPNGVDEVRASVESPAAPEVVQTSDAPAGAEEHVESST